ncbi:hypothetical protein TNIN_415271 [Trichonephila inaurata madagascariensis]|uniref:Uncharacterized protein n=1 Tax=Trichonephila inaurata madagascariensis TaxID=2747483 RepID=A0A8X6Y6L1_9ARAC|nr:hypothetical protein TNIN_415271 [Trichonephila inaurata madagascariensis]
MDLTTDQPNVMELSLPSSTDSTRPGTPTVTNCERLHDITTDIKKFGIVIENIQSTIRALHLNGINDDNDPTLMDQTRRLQEYQRLQHLAVIINSIVRPNVSYAQAANNSAPSNTSNSNNRQQMAPLAKGNPAIKTPTQASRVLAPPPQPVNANTNPNLVLINQTLQGIIQALSTLAQQINTLNFSENSPQTNNSKKSKQAKKRELHALVEAIIDDDE